MGTETYENRSIHQHENFGEVKLNNPLMGTETCSRFLHDKSHFLS